MHSLGRWQAAPGVHHANPYTRMHAHAHTMRRLLGLEWGLFGGLLPSTAEEAIPAASWASEGKGDFSFRSLLATLMCIVASVLLLAVQTPMEAVGSDSSGAVMPFWVSVGISQL